MVYSTSFIVSYPNGMSKSRDVLSKLKQMNPISRSTGFILLRHFSESRDNGSWVSLRAREHRARLRGQRELVVLDGVSRLSGSHHAARQTMHQRTLACSFPFLHIMCTVGASLVRMCFNSE